MVAQSLILCSADQPRVTGRFDAIYEAHPRGTLTYTRTRHRPETDHTIGTMNTSTAFSSNGWQASTADLWIQSGKSTRLRRAHVRDVETAATVHWCLAGLDLSFVTGPWLRSTIGGLPRTSLRRSQEKRITPYPSHSDQYPLCLQSTRHFSPPWVFDSPT